MAAGDALHKLVNTTMSQLTAENLNNAQTKVSSRISYTHCHDTEDLVKHMTKISFIVQADLSLSRMYLWYVTR